MRVVAYTLLVTGHVSHFLPILKELGERGHDVRLFVATSGGAPGEIEGVPVRAVPWLHGAALDQAGSLPADRGWAWAANPAGYAAYGEPAALPFEGLLRHENPDLLLIDPMLWGGMVVAEATGRPWATVAYDPTFIRGTGFDLRGPGFPPARHMRHRAAHRLYAFAQRLSGAELLKMLNAARKKRGLGRLEKRGDLFLRPPLILAATVEPFEYPRTDWPASLEFVGPLHWEPSVEAPTWLSEVRRDRPLVLLAGSSVPKFGKRGLWAQMVLDALADEPVTVIATLATETLVREVPENARVEHFIPHSQVLPLCSCVVCHGGTGVTQKALMHGVPVVAIPVAYEYEVARRVEVARAGVYLDGRTLTVDAIREAVRKALTCGAGAAATAKAFASSGGAGAAAVALEKLEASYGAVAGPVDLRQS